ncbi:MAG: ribulose-phosphate 3-epimerase [Sphaerochaetaceae bacterium]|jgi:ribulose-phosphate 3-epimerase|nr:ribulose-phosphate 3-epimerase [Sphaerochaetaceae bacterium]NLY07780.1 ribulose-phosphate 3-epimerase [Spirochaetales bacterium]
MKNVFVSPSIMTADFLHLGEEIAKVEQSGAPWLHLDVMDGSFVPNISFGPKVISDIRKGCGLFLDVHLMVIEPDHLLKAFAEAGSDCLTVHLEACKDLKRTLETIKSLGIQCGISIKPATSVSDVVPYLDIVDQILVMSVEPGFGGQKFMPASVDKVRELAQTRGDRKYLINIDGGISLSNIEILKQAGADAVVAGSSFFNSTDQKDFVRRMSQR